jgi:diguanylate cyclase (GGDEF)-like protein/PAS domain S-box-containing protein
MNDRIATLEYEIKRLQKIIDALGDRMEDMTNASATDFGLFQTSVILEDKIRSRTHELETALHRIESYSSEMLGAKARIERSEELFRLAFSSSLIGMAIIGIDVQFIKVNPALCALFGMNKYDLIGSTYTDLTHHDDQDKEQHFFKELIAGKRSSFDLEKRCIDRAGNILWVSSNVSAIKDHSQYIIHVENITERVAASQALMESQAKFHAIFELMPAPTTVSRLEDGMLFEASRSFADFFGYEISEVINHTTGTEDLGLWVDNDSRSIFIEKIKNKRGGIINYETVLKCRNGKQVHVNISGRELEVNNKHFLVTEYHDITEIKLQQEQLDRMAHYDSLTGIPNRLFFADYLIRTIPIAAKSNKMIAVCYLDLDGFKLVNDHFGHSVGDGLLVKVAKRLRNTIRASDVVARIGGDEFVILLSGLAGNEELNALLSRIIYVISRQYTIHNCEILDLSASVGVALYPEDSDQPDVLLQKADHAMYMAKNKGKNQFCRYFDETKTQK